MSRRNPLADIGATDDLSDAEFDDLFPDDAEDEYGIGDDDDLDSDNPADEDPDDDAIF